MRGRQMLISRIVACAIAPSRTSGQETNTKLLLLKRSQRSRTWNKEENRRVKIMQVLPEKEDINVETPYRLSQFITGRNPDGVDAGWVRLQTGLQHGQVGHGVAAHENGAVGEIAFRLLDEQTNSVAFVEDVAGLGLKSKRVGIRS